MSPVHAMHSHSHLHYHTAKQEKFTDNSHHYSTQEAPTTSTTSSVLLMNISLQIRAEKPYYMADPEVDSLVSRTAVQISAASGNVSIFPSNTEQSSSADMDGLKLYRKCIFASLGHKKGEGKKIVPVTLNGSKIEKHFKYFQRLKLLMACWKRKEKILFLFKFKLPVTPQSFIFLQERGK